MFVELFAHVRMRGKKLMQLRMVVNKPLVIDQLRIFLQLLGHLGMVSQELTHIDDFATRDVVVARIVGGVRIIAPSVVVARLVVRHLAVLLHLLIFLRLLLLSLRWTLNWILRGSALHRTLILRGSSCGLCDRGRCPKSGGKRQGCQPVSGCQSCALHVDSASLRPKVSCVNGGAMTNARRGPRAVEREAALFQELGGGLQVIP